PDVGAPAALEQPAPGVRALLEQGRRDDERGDDPGHGEHGEQRLTAPGPQIGPDPPPFGPPPADHAEPCPPSGARWSSTSASQFDDVARGPADPAPHAGHRPVVDDLA